MPQQHTEPPKPESVMSQAKETRQRRAAVTAILGTGWKGSKGSEGSRDIYVRRAGRMEVCVKPGRTVDGNFYVGAYEHGKRGALGFSHTETIEQAAVIANRFFA
jgi:hypothetical protein